MPSNKSMSIFRSKKVISSIPAFLFVLSFCLLISCAQFEPLPKSQWPVEVKPMFYSTVMVFWEGSGTTHLGHGVIIHSCPKHGTYVLTADHLVDGHANHAIQVGIIDYSFENKADKEFTVFTAKVIYPAETSGAKGNSTDKKLDEVIKQLKMVTEDFALIKLDTDLIFKTAELWMDKASPPEEGTEIVSIYPKRYPYVTPGDMKTQTQQGGITYGQSGSGIFYGNKLVGICTKMLRDTDIGILNPKIPDIITNLNEAGLGYIVNEK